jgi:hypothetical protein
LVVSRDAGELWSPPPRNAGQRRTGPPKLLRMGASRSRSMRHPHKLLGADQLRHRSQLTPQHAGSGHVLVRRELLAGIVTGHASNHQAAAPELPNAATNRRAAEAPKVQRTLRRTLVTRAVGARARRASKGGRGSGRSGLLGASWRRGSERRRANARQAQEGQQPILPRSEAAGTGQSRRGLVRASPGTPIRRNQGAVRRSTCPGPRSRRLRRRRTSRSCEPPASVGPDADGNGCCRAYPSRQ